MIGGKKLLSFNNILRAVRNFSIHKISYFRGDKSHNFTPYKFMQLSSGERRFSIARRVKHGYPQQGLNKDSRQCINSKQS